MSALGELLEGAVREDALRLDKGLFAAERYGTVRGRIARRRAARAAGVGGASVLGVGAVAVGAWQVPWVGLVYGAPSGQPSVVCTSATPSAVVAKALAMPDSASYAIVDDETGDVYFVGGTVDEPQAWTMDGAKQRFFGNGGLTELILDSGARVAVLLDQGSGVGLQAPSGVTVMTRSEFEDFVTPGPPSVDPNGVSVVGEEAPGVATWLLFQDGAQIAKAEFDGNVLFFAFMNGETADFVAFEGVNTALALPDGSTADVVFDGTTLTVTGTSVTAGSAGASQAVNCVTTTPEPSVSAEPSEITASDPALSAVPSASPDPAVVDEFEALPSPFQCGSELMEPEQGIDELSIGDIRWASAQEAEDAIVAYYEGAEESVQLNSSGDAVPIAKLQFAPGTLERGVNSWDLADPANRSYGTMTGPGVDEDSATVVGASYVLVSGDEVVATGLPFGPDAQAQWISPHDLGGSGVGAEVYLLNATAGLAACEGVTEAELAAAQLVAVAGIKLKVDGVETGPFYTWKTVPTQP